MEITAYSILYFSCISGLLCIFWTGWGNLLIWIGTVLFFVLTGQFLQELPFQGHLFFLYLCGEILEYFLMMIGQRKFYISSRGMLAMVLGALIGVGFFAGGLVRDFWKAIIGGAAVAGFFTEMAIGGSLMKVIRENNHSPVMRWSCILAKLGISFLMLQAIYFQIIYFKNG